MAALLRKLVKTNEFYLFLVIVVLSVVIQLRSGQFFTANNWPFGSALTVVMMIFLAFWMVGYLRSAAREARDPVGA